jgi:CHAT domain-containing protein
MPVTGGKPSNMDTDLFLQNLRVLSLEEGKAYIKEHIDELSDHAATGNLLADEALRILYSPFVSLKLAELLVFFGEYVHRTSSHALGLKAKGDALMLIGHHKAAVECLDAAGEEFRRLGDVGNWARSRIGWIYSAAWLGRVEEALQQAEQAHNVFLQLGEPYWVCVIDHNTAMIYEYIGRYQDAVRLYERMLAIYPTLTDQSEIYIKRSIALAEMNQAFDLASLGNFEQAYRLQQQAQAGFIALGETELTSSVEADLADLDYTQGYYGSALRRYYQALDSLVQNNLDTPMLLAEIKVRTANCLVKLNRAQEACFLASEAVEISRKSGISLNIGNTLREYATTLDASNRLKEALVVLDEAWTLLNSGGFDPLAFVTKYQKAEILLKLGSFTAAYDQARLAREYFEAKGLVARSVRASLVMASTLIENARQAGVDRKKEQQSTHLQEAISLCKEISSQAHQYHLQEESYRSYYLLGQIFALQEDFTKAARYYRAAIAQIERILDDLVYDLSPSFLQSTWAVYEDMIALCLQQGQVERAFSYLEQARSMALRQYFNKSKATRSGSIEQEDMASTSLLQQNNAAILRTQHELRGEQEWHRYYSVLLADIDLSVSPTIDREVIQQQLKRCEEKISELSERLHLYQSDPRLISQKRTHRARKAKQVDIKQLRHSLSPEQILLAYFLYKGRLVIFAATKEQLVTRELPNGMEQLERLLPLLHAHLNPRGWFDSQKPPEQIARRLLNKLYDLLVKPVVDLMPPSPGHLTIVPYGPLHKLPFHALHDGSRYLVENFKVNYLPASSILMHLVAHGGEQRVRSTLIGVSTKPPLVFGYSDNGHLQRVQDEAKAVASLLDGQCYLEGEATIAQLIEQAPGSSIIHLATHGQSRLDAPNFSYVRLADGQLNAIDAFNLDLRACELVTLSGCETGLALSGGGDEQLGLGRAFLAAGASSLVMSLWPVEDNATNELMKLFYHFLLKGESKVQALRAAQCHLLHRSDSIYTHPYFWAAFRLVGEVGSLGSQSAIGRSLAFAANL